MVSKTSNKKYKNKFVILKKMKKFQKEEEEAYLYLSFHGNAEECNKIHNKNWPKYWNIKHIEEG